MHLVPLSSSLFSSSNAKMRSASLLLAILSISSSIASATFCFPRSSQYAVPISALEAGYEFFPFFPKPSNPPVQKPLIPTPMPQTPPPAAQPETPPVAKPEPPSVAKPAPPPVAKPLTPPADKAPSPGHAPLAGGPIGGAIGGALDGALVAVIKLWCAKTDDPELCFTLIKPLVGTIKVSHDATGVLKLAMVALKEQTDDAIKTAQKIVADPKTDKMSAAALHDCLDTYDDAQYSLGKVEDALLRNDKGTVNSLLSAVSTDYDTCENGFDDFEVPSLMADVDKKLMKINGICLAIAAAANLMSV